QNFTACAGLQAHEYSGQAREGGPSPRGQSLKAGVSTWANVVRVGRVSHLSGGAQLRCLSRDSRAGFQNELMSLVLLDFLRGKGQSKREPSLPGLPLIHVIRAQEITALAGHGIQCALVEVGKIKGHSH